MKLIPLFLILTASEAANILGIFPIPSISHQLVYRTVMQELHDRGHNITVITTDPIQIDSPNYTQIDLHAVSYKLVAKAIEKFNISISGKPSKFLLPLMLAGRYKYMTDILEAQLNEAHLQAFFNGNETFDLIIYEQLYGPIYLGAVCKYSAPFIGITSLGGSYNMHEAVGNPTHPAYLPDFSLQLLDDLSFSGRVQSLLYYLFYSLIYKFYVLPRHDKLSKQFITEDCPYVGDMEKNASIMLVNTHYALAYPRPNVPAMIEFGGPPTHIPTPKPLPEDLKSFLDNATEGVAYFSLGSNVKSNTLTDYRRTQFIEAFGRLKLKVLWKWEDESLQDKPSNVKIAKWLPQSDVLAHPNIRAFITQCGLQSMGEAIHHHVPLVVVPLIGDQEFNAKKLVQMEVAIRLDMKTITADEIFEAVTTVIDDHRYKKNMKEYSLLLSDQPQQPIEKAVWWIEYVLRHKGARHMRTAALNMPLYQYFLLDVIAALLSPLVLIYLVIKFIKIILFRSSKSKID